MGDPIQIHRISSATPGEIHEVINPHSWENEVYEPNHTNKPEYSEALVSFKSVPFGGAGSLTVIVAPPGSGKTGLVNAIGAKYLNPESDGLGFELSNSVTGISILDTESTKADYWKQWDRTMRRAGLTNNAQTPNAKFFSLTMISKVEHRCEFLRSVISRQREGCTGNVIIMDGGTDFIRDPNDLKECSEHINELTALANIHGAAIIVTVHPNPAVGATKARGHYGSEIMRKAETVLHLQKDFQTGQRTLTTKVFNGKVRNGEDVEHYFDWDDELQMFTSSSVIIKPKKNISKLKELAEGVLNRKLHFTYTELTDAICEFKKCKIDNAKKLVKELGDSGFVTQKDGFYKKNIENDDL